MVEVLCGNRGEGVVSSGENVSVISGGANGEIVAGFPMGLLENTGKTSHTVSHSRLILVMSFCRLAWKEKMVKLIEELTDQRRWRSVGGSKGLSGLWTTGSPPVGLVLKV